MHGGVALLIPKQINYKVKNSFFNINGEAISVEITMNGKKLYLTNIYRHPKSNTDDFLTHLSGHINQLPNAGDSLVVGDFNINAANNNISFHKLEECMFTCYYTQLIKSPTRITETSSTIIDHIWQKCTPDYILQTKILTDSVADHLHPCIEINLRRPKVVEYITYREYSAENIEKLNISLGEVDWNELVIDKPIETATGNLVFHFNKKLDECCPEITRRKNPRTDPIQPWYTKALLVSRRTKNNLILKASRTKLGADIKAKNDYIRIYNDLIITAKEMYFRTETEKAMGNSKKLWDNFKNITRKFGKQKNELNCIKINNREERDPQIIANTVNEYFTKIAPELTKNMNPRMMAEVFLPPKSQTSFQFKSIGQHKLEKVIKSLQAKKSCGVDNISNCLLKKIYQPLLHPLSNIINRSLCEGQVPNHFKIAKVVPIPKKGSTMDLNNLRPISLLPTFSKVLEKVVEEQIREYLHKNNILDDHQYGFRPKHSCEHALIDIVNYIVEQSKKNNKVAAVFIDVKKAFDCIKHTIILQKLENIGIQGNALHWFKSYLKERTQYTQIGDKKSDRLEIICGVPQGSVLGPLLFILSILDFGRNTKFHSVFFADDTTLLLSSPGTETLHQSLEQELRKVELWFESNYLVLHPDKTRIMFFNLKPSDRIGPVSLCSQGIRRVGRDEEEKSFKLLGVLIDDKLSWQPHAQYVANKMRKGTSLLFCAKRYTNLSTRKILYQALVESHIRYCVSVWGPSNSENRSIILSQKVALRTIPYEYSIHTDNIMKDNNILSYKDIITLSLAITAHKTFYHRMPESLSKMFTWSGNNNTRRGPTILLPKYKSTSQQKQVVFQAGKVWNSLPIDSKKAFREKAFKKLLVDSKVNRYERVLRCSNRGCPQCY